MIPKTIFHPPVQPGLRRFLPTLLAATVVSSVALAPAPAEAKRKVRIKLATLAPKGSPWLASIERMGRRWKEVSEGQVRLKIYPGGVLGDESDMISKMRVGQLHAATVTSIGLGDIDRSTVALQIPMLFNSYEELDYVRDRVGPKMAKDLEAKGFVVLEWGDAGWVHFFSKRKAVFPDEMRKQKMFVWAGDPQAEEAWRSARFNVVPTASTDVLQGLQTGRLEAFATVPLYALTSQWFALADHMLKIRWAPLSGATIVKKDVWDKIDPDLREKLRTIAVEESRANRTKIRGMGDKAVKAMTDRGLEVHVANEAAEKAWQEVAEGSYEYIRTEIVPEHYFAEVIKLVAEYREKAK